MSHTMPVGADRRRPVTAEAQYRPCPTEKIAILTPESQLLWCRKSGGFSPSYHCYTQMIGLVCVQTDPS